MDNAPALKRPVRSYHIRANTKVTRASGTCVGERFHTTRDVTYDVSDIERTYANVVGRTIWVFRLPPSAFPWLHLEVDQRDVYFEGEV